MVARKLVIVFLISQLKRQIAKRNLPFFYFIDLFFTVVIDAISIRLILPHLFRNDLNVGSLILPLLKSTFNQVSVSFASF